MTKVDHFESDFKSAAKAVYEHGPIKLDRVLVVSDESRAAARTFEIRLQDFLKGLGGADNPETYTLPSSLAATPIGLSSRSSGVLYDLRQRSFPCASYVTTP